MYIGIDLGGTNIAAGLVSDDGKILVQDSTPTLSERPIGEIVKDMAMLCERLAQKHGISLSEVTAIGIGSPGSIDFENGIVAYSNNLKMNNFPLAEELSKLTGLTVKVDNDANCAAMGEYTVSGNGSKDFILVTLGTGVGSGIISHGNMVRGFNGAGGEAGHTSLVFNGEPCNCGRNGCWEAYASVTALIRQTERAMKENPDSLMNEYAQKEGKVSGRTAFDAAKAGDSAALEVVKHYEEYVAEGIVNLINIFQPAVVAIGGGISREGDYLLNPIKEYIGSKNYNKNLAQTQIVTAKLFNDAGIIGAAMIAK